jgi:hypothetical protein
MATKTYRMKPVEAQPRETIVNNAPKLFQMFDPGMVSHQGDLIVVAIAMLPASAKPRKNRQLADGSTQGSRHILERGDIFDANPSDICELIFRATKVRVDPRCVGPVFVAPKSPTEHDLTHPEHGHQGFPTGSVCAVVYQRSLDAEEREARVRD